MPRPTKDHAGLIVDFAQTCLKRFQALVNELEQSLGPGTAELGLRVGLHSGPVTSGVLRGKKSRFRLFRDTVNVASRIEASGEKNQIHVSSVTAELLRERGIDQLLIPRKGMVNLKGKGLAQSYFICLRQGGFSSGPSTETVNTEGMATIEENCWDSSGADSKVSVTSLSLSRAPSLQTVETNGSILV